MDGTVSPDAGPVAGDESNAKISKLRRLRTLMRRSRPRGTRGPNGPMWTRGRGQPDCHGETMRRLRELEPGLTVGALRARYPGRDSPQAGRFIGALLAAGLPP